MTVGYLSKPLLRTFRLISVQPRPASSGRSPWLDACRESYWAWHVCDRIDGWCRRTVPHELTGPVPTTTEPQTATALSIRSRRRTSRRSQRVWSIHLKPAGYTRRLREDGSHSARHRQHDVSRARRTARSSRSTRPPAPRSGNSSCPTAICRRSAASRTGPARDGVPAVDHLRRHAGRLYSIKASDGTLNDRLRRERRPQSQDARGHGDRDGSAPTRCCLRRRSTRTWSIIGAGTGEGAGGSNAGTGPAGDTRAFDAQDRQAGVDVPHRAAAGRVRLRHVGREQREKSIGRQRRGVTRRSTSSAASSTCRSARRTTTASASIVPATISSHRRWSPSMPTPANTSGTSSSCITTSGTTTRSQRRCSSICRRDGTDGSRPHHREQDRIDVHAQSRHRQADLRHRRAPGPEERPAQRAGVADAAVPGEARRRSRRTRSLATISTRASRSISRIASTWLTTTT